MKRLTAIAALAVLALNTGASAQKAPPAPLAWMAGCWASDDGLNRETWSASNGGVMFGYATTMKDGQLAFYEQSRIELRSSPATYTVSPNGLRAISFYQNAAAPPAVDKKGKPVPSVSFENAEHDFPQRISYSLDGKVLSATVSKLDGSGAQNYSWKRCK